MDDAVEVPVQESQPAGAPAAPGRRTACFALYIDADNQTAQRAGALVELLRDGLGAVIRDATIAGNAPGKLSAWVTALRERIPDLPTTEISVPCRQDAADAALILALGTRLAEYIRTDTRVVVVSRDALLHAAAERAKEAGCRIYVAYADSENQTARSPVLTTFLLPAAPVANVPGAGTASKPTAPPTPKTAVAPGLDIAAVAAQVRSLCKSQPGGGFRATDVGSALSRIGFKTPAERKRILALLPGRRERGPASGKILVF